MRWTCFISFFIIYFTVCCHEYHSPMLTSAGRCPAGMTSSCSEMPACVCPAAVLLALIWVGWSGVRPASLSDAAALSSFSRKVSTLCSRGWPWLDRGDAWWFWFSGVNLVNSGSRWRARGEGRLDTRLPPRRALRRAWRISHSFGDTPWWMENKHRHQHHHVTTQGEMYSPTQDNKSETKITDVLQRPN